MAATSKTVTGLLTGEFGWFFAGRTVDLAGSSMTTVALALAVLEITGRPTDLGIVLAANMIPALALLLLGGAVADRFSQRTVLVAASLLSATSLGTTAMLIIADRYNLILVSGLAVLTGATSAFTQPAFRSIVPSLVSEGDLQRGNALMASSENAARILGPMVASVLVVTVGGGWALAVDAGTYLFAALAYSRLKRRPSSKAANQTLIRDLVDGWAVFRSLRWLVLMTFSFALMNLFNVGPWNVLGPLIVTGEDGAVGWGTTQTVRAAGFLLMSVVAVKLTFDKPMRDGRLWGALAGLPLLALGFSGGAVVVSIAAFIGGLGITVAAITWDTTLQAAVPPESLARVAAYDELFSFSANPLSLLAVGPLSQVVGRQELAMICGFGLIAASLFPLLDSQIRTDNVGASS